MWEARQFREVGRAVIAKNQVMLCILKVISSYQFPIVFDRNVRFPTRNRKTLSMQLLVPAMQENQGEHRDKNTYSFVEGVIHEERDFQMKVGGKSSVFDYHSSRLIIAQR